VEGRTFTRHASPKAHLDAVLSHLCRLFDKTQGNLGLGKFLRTVKAHPELFSDTAFRERLKDNPHVDTLVTDRVIDDAELGAELESVSDSDPLVSRLLDLRTKLISQLDAERVMQNVPATGLTAEDIEALLNRARTITSKYSLLYRAPVYGGIAGADDYKSTLRWVRKALVAYNAEIDGGRRWPTPGQGTRASMASTTSEISRSAAAGLSAPMNSQISSRSRRTSG